MRKLVPTALVLALSCGDDSNQNTTPDANTDPCKVRLTPASNVKAALIDAQSGDMICFGDGTYTFTDELSLTVDDVTLRGNMADRTKVVFDFSGQVAAGNANGISVRGADDFVIEGLTVKDTPGDGVRVTESKNVTFRNVAVLWSTPGRKENGAYGIYPVLVENVLVENCEVRGASDAGIYVGQSKNVLVRNSHAEGNVAGIEIENTDDAEVRDNTTKGNVVGLLVFSLPNLVRKSGARTKVHGNTIEANNIAQFAEEGGVVSFVPPGAGMIVFANDRVEIHDNTFKTNESTALVVVSCQTVQFISGNTVMCNDPDPAYDNYAEGINIHDNTFTGNGTAPKGFFQVFWPNTMPDPLYDIMWDGLRDANKPDTTENKICIKNNGTITYAELDLENLGQVASTDLTAHDCTQPAVPGINVTW